MRGVAGQHEPPVVVAWYDALVHAVRALVEHVVTLGARHDDLQVFLDGVFGELILDRHILARIDGHAPAAGHFQQTEIAALFPAIGDVGQAFQMLFERKQRRDKQRGLRIGLAIEGQIHRLAHETARAIRTHGDARADNAILPARAHGHRDVIFGLRDSSDFGVEMHLYRRQRLRRVSAAPARVSIVRIAGDRDALCLSPAPRDRTPRVRRWDAA